MTETLVTSSIIAAEITAHETSRGDHTISAASLETVQGPKLVSGCEWAGPELSDALSAEVEALRQMLATEQPLSQIPDPAASSTIQQLAWSPRPTRKQVNTGFVTWVKSRCSVEGLDWGYSVLNKPVWRFCFNRLPSGWRAVAGL